MRGIVSVVFGAAAVVGAAAVTAAQPAPPATPLTDPWAPPPAPPPPAPPPDPEAPSALPASVEASAPPAADTASTVAAEPAPAASAAPEGRRPGAAFGLGVGFDASLRLGVAANATSVRFRFASGTTLEPSVALVRTSATERDGTSEVTSTSSGVELRAAVRHPIRARGPMELSLIAGLAVSRFQHEGEGVDDDYTSTRVALHAGVGLDYWFNRSWGASMSLIDPVVGYTKYVSEQGTGEASRTARGFGIEFQVGGMIHLYF